jgi:AraC family transcriptional regulator
MTRHGKLLPLSQAASVVASSVETCWQGINVQQYRLAPTECDAHSTAAYSWVLQLSLPVKIEYQDRDRFHTQQMNPGGVSLHAIGELPGFRLYQMVEIFEIVLMPQFVDRVLQGMNPVSTNLIGAYGIIDAQIQRIAASLKAELEMGCPGGQLLGESLATALVAHTFTHYGSQRQIESDPSNGLSRKDLQRVLSFIDDRLSHDLSLNALAEITSLSPHYFALQFKRSLGVSPHQYVIGQRIERAKYLLRDNNTAIVEIAYALGFANQSHFNFHFKRTLGVTPRQYRRTAR